MSEQQEQGNLRAYVIGFMLSLVFTLIPYYLVINHKASSSILLDIILGFALTQMIIQISFFLHIGRGPKPKWNLFFFISTAGIILMVVGGSILIINNLHYNMKPSDQVQKLINDEGVYQVGGTLTGACQGQHNNYQVSIKDGKIIPMVTLANRCDTLTFISGDNQVHKITFGVYPGHQTYAGEANLTIRKGMNETITLSEAGTYHYYDQVQPQITGEFTIGQ